MNNKNNLIKVTKKKPIKTKSSFIEKRVLLFGGIGIIIFVALVILVRNFNQEPLEVTLQDIKIDIKSKNTNNKNNRFVIDECEDCEKLTIKRRDNNEIFFEEYFKGDNVNPHLEKYILAEAKKGDRLNSQLKLPRIDQGYKRLVDISLDISNSVVTRDKDSVIKKAENKYSDLVFQKIKNYLREPSNNGLLPNDTINVRFYGPDFKDNPCNNKLVIKYTEPEWDANIIYAKKNKQLLIELGDKLPSEVKEVGNEITTNDEEVIYQKIKEFWENGIKNPNTGCHSGTYLIPHLTQISDDIVNKKYDNYEFLLVTDGEFALRDDEITGGKEVYSTLKDYDVIKSYLQKKRNKELIINGSPICKNPGGRFIIVGMEYGDNFSYRQTVQEFYRELLKSCQLVFENF